MCTEILLLLMPSIMISAYYQILRQRFGVKCFLGLTATATKETVLNIAKHLNLSDSEEDCVKGTILPPNLNLSVSKDCFKEQVGTLTGLSACVIRRAKQFEFWIVSEHYIFLSLVNIGYPTYIFVCKT